MNVHKFLVVLFSDGCNDIKSSESKIRVNKMYAILALLRGLNDKEARAQDLKNFGPQKQIIENTTPLKYYDFKNLKKISDMVCGDATADIAKEFAEKNFKKGDNGKSGRSVEAALVLLREKYDAESDVGAVAKEIIDEILSDKNKVEAENMMKYLIRQGEENMDLDENKWSVQDDSTPEAKIKEIIENGATQIILTGAPGTGKTRLAKKIAEEFCQEQTKKYELVQFHPSYDYTDFVEGIRPVEYKNQDGNEKVEFRKVDGIFKKFCRKVADLKDDPDGKNNERKYFFIIDEINRADLSKVFGELMYCLETDKRGSENRIQTQYANLHTYNPEEGDYYSEDIFEKGFYIPKNVIIIGTMNDIDRSVESMDFALRRRFVWREITVEEDETKLAKTIMEILFPDETWDEESLKSKISLQVAKYILYINKQQIDKQRGLNKHYYISQGQFSNIPGVEKWKEELLLEENSTDECVKKYAEKLIKDVWNLRLESLLYEYVRGEGNEEKFVNECNLEAFKEWEKVQKNAQNNTPSEEKE